MKFLLFSALILSAKACLPIGPGGSGQLQPFELSSTPKFRLVYSPPVAWTYADAPTQNQATTLEIARDTAIVTITDAFKSAFTKFNAIVPADFNLNTDEVVPQKIILTTNLASVKPGEGISELGVVGQTCQPQGSALTCDAGVGLMPLSLNQTIFVENGPLLNGNQWSDIANQVFITLSSDSNVYFQEELIAEKN